MAYFGISDEQSLLQQSVDVSNRRIVHQQAQAGLEVTSNYYKTQTKSTFISAILF